MSKIQFSENTLFFCDGSKCGKYKELRKYAKDRLKELGLKDQVEIIKIECTDRCKSAPIVCAQPQNQWIAQAREKDIEAVLLAML
jgi:(2Fe-2S) ferredoxin